MSSAFNVPMSQRMSSGEPYSSPEQRQGDSNQAAGGGGGSGAGGGGAAAAPRKKRVRNWTAEDRAAHRVLERSRREAFKDRLTNLAALIPSLETTDPSRLSKHVVLDESISLHTQQREQIEALKAERDQLLAEVKELRANALSDGAPPLGAIPSHGDIQGLDNMPQNDIGLPGQDWSQLPSGEMDGARLTGPALDHSGFIASGLMGTASTNRAQQSWGSPDMAINSDSHQGIPMNVTPMMSQQSWQMDPESSTIPTDSRSLSQEGLPFQMPQMQAPVPLFYSNNYSG